MRVVLTLTAAFAGFFLGHLNARLAWCDERTQEAADHDEELYGKYAIGPKLATPLNDAVAAFNRSVAEHRFNSDFPARQRDLTDRDMPEPLSFDEVLEAIKNRDPETYTPQNPATPLLENIVTTKTLPPHSVLTFSDRWVALSDKIGRERRLWRIALEMMTGKNQGAAFPLREQQLDIRKNLKPRPGFQWVQEPRPRDAAGRWVGWFDHKVRVKFGPDREALIVITTRSKDEIGELNVVAFDEKETRDELEGGPRR